MSGRSFGSALDALDALGRELAAAGIAAPARQLLNACPDPVIAPRLTADELVELARRRPRDPALQREVLVREIRGHLSKLQLVDAKHLETALAGIAAVPREEFTPPESAELAYLPMSGDIGHGQTISHPYVVAAMTAALQVDARSTVLEVGTGCGYQAAVLASIAGSVTSVEIVPALAEAARARLVRLGFGRVRVTTGDGATAPSQHGRYDAILVAAGAAAVPPPLLDGLVEGGLLIMPIGPAQSREELIVVRRRGEVFEARSLGRVRFVPLTGPCGRTPSVGDPSAI